MLVTLPSRVTVHLVWFTDAWPSEAHWEWVILSLTLHTSLCLNSPTSEPLVNVGISILAFPLFVLFAWPIRVVLRLKCAAGLCTTVEPRVIFHSPSPFAVNVMHSERSAQEKRSKRVDFFFLDVKNILSGYSQHTGCPFQGVKSSLFTDLITDSGISLARIYHKAPLSLHLMESALHSLPGLL